MFFEVNEFFIHTHFRNITLGLVSKSSTKLTYSHTNKVSPCQSFDSFLHLSQLLLSFPYPLVSTMSFDLSTVLLPSRSSDKFSQHTNSSLQSELYIVRSYSVRGCLEARRPSGCLFWFSRWSSSFRILCYILSLYPSSLKKGVYSERSY